MSHEKTLKLLRSLGDFDGPFSPAAILQTQTLMDDFKRFVAKHPNATFRLTVDGPDETASEILAKLEADEAEISALRSLLGKQDIGDTN
ncbi:MAG: hypothetical protein JSS55_00005 [Proteobacteria bacterium]|nr:hypothetical protein [Pseudomonadota bacterium]